MPRRRERTEHRTNLVAGRPERNGSHRSKLARTTITELVSSSEFLLYSFLVARENVVYHGFFDASYETPRYTEHVIDEVLPKHLEHEVFQLALGVSASLHGVKANTYILHNPVSTLTAEEIIHYAFEQVRGV